MCYDDDDDASFAALYIIICGWLDSIHYRMVLCLAVDEAPMKLRWSSDDAFGGVCSSRFLMSLLRLQSTMDHKTAVFVINMGRWLEALHQQRKVNIGISETSAAVFAFKCCFCLLFRVALLQRLLLRWDHVALSASSLRQYCKKSLPRVKNQFEKSLLVKY